MLLRARRPSSPRLALSTVVGEATPEVAVQVKGDRFSARARIANAEEKPELWTIMTREWPDYDTYQASTDRVIPVMVLEPAD